VESEKQNPIVVQSEERECPGGLRSREISCWSCLRKFVISDHKLWLTDPTGDLSLGRGGL